MSETSTQLPVIFIGHGSPMNAIADNSFTRSLHTIAKKFETPKSILVISAHWITGGTLFQSSAKPKTIHDFGGFPQALYQIQYPASGNPTLASTLGSATEDWGLDHGSWAVLRHIYPEANIPVVQMSLDRALTFKEHFELGEKLKELRSQGVLILSSGNIVHNLRQIRWEEDAPALPWAIEFDQIVQNALETKNYHKLINILQEYPELTRMSHPSYEHYVPLLYTIGASHESDKLTTIFEGIQNASISMRSFILG